MITPITEATITEATLPFREDLNISLETGKIARQASASVIAVFGNTTVLCTVMHSTKKIEYAGFAPLTTHFVAKHYAFGRIPQNFPRREGKPSEQEVLISRMLDRSIRPLFPENHCYETQVSCTLLSYDQEYSPLLPSIIGSSAALMLSGIDIKPIVSLILGKKDDEYLIVPTHEQIKQSQMELTISTDGSKITMIECEAKDLPKQDVKDAIKIANEAARPIVEFIKSFVEKAKCSSAISKEKIAYRCSQEEISNLQKLKEELRSSFELKLEKALKIKDKQSKKIEISKINDEAIEQFSSAEKNITSSHINIELKKIKREILKNEVFTKGKRIDGRVANEIRNLEAEVDLIPNVHGSALFTRGDTQVLSIVTIGYPQEEQTVDFLGHNEKASFLLHYNFYPFAVGELALKAGVSRREIGHGKLALKAIKNIIPSKESFPCTIRVVAEVTESDGSSSMASVVSATLALMSSGVPMKKHVAGIAMGLLCNNDDYVILSDISGDEDDAGYMDFKLSGTTTGITAIQMDVKNEGVTEKQINEIIDQATEGTAFIIKKMSETIEGSRPSVSKNAPKLIELKVDKGKIKDIVGSQGRTIKSICEQTLAKIDISQDGNITIAGLNECQIQEAKSKIEDIAMGPQYKKIYKGVVTKNLNFGVMVCFCENKQGLIHNSNLPLSEAGDIAKAYPEGLEINVELDSVDQMNRYGLKLAGTEKEQRETSEATGMKKNNHTTYSKNEDTEASVTNKEVYCTPSDKQSNQKTSDNYFSNQYEKKRPRNIRDSNKYKNSSNQKQEFAQQKNKDIALKNTSRNNRFEQNKIAIQSNDKINKSTTSANQKKEKRKTDDENESNWFF